MTEIEFINSSLNCQIDNELVTRIESYYGVKLPDGVKGYFSFVPDDYFCGSWRVLSSKELLMSKEWALQDFVSCKVVPLIDIGDMEYISYIPAENIWVVVNDGDGSVFRKKEKLSEYL